jgi:hypothetical protein
LLEQFLDQAKYGVPHGVFEARGAAYGELCLEAGEQHPTMCAKLQPFCGGRDVLWIVDHEGYRHRKAFANLLGGEACCEAGLCAEADVLQVSG